MTRTNTPGGAQARSPCLTLRFGGHAGFTLIEALVAFVILPMAMIILQRGVVSSVDASMRARDQLDAGLVMQTLFASPTVAEAGLPMSGRMNGHDWAVQFEDVPLAAGASGATGGTVFRPMRMIVDVRVSTRNLGGLLSGEQIQSVREPGKPAQ